MVVVTKPCSASSACYNKASACHIEKFGNWRSLRGVNAWRGLCATSCHMEWHLYLVDTSISTDRYLPKGHVRATGDLTRVADDSIWRTLTRERLREGRSQKLRRSIGSTNASKRQMLMRGLMQQCRRLEKAQQNVCT